MMGKEGMIDEQHKKFPIKFELPTFGQNTEKIRTNSNKKIILRRDKTKYECKF
jgi:hypothetical protein